MGKVKNFTSSVPVERTVAMIEKDLVSIGATSVQKDYRNGELHALFFSVRMEGIGNFKYRIPSSVANVEKFIADIPGYSRKPETWLKQQAARTAWRIVYDWVGVTCAMIKVGKVDAMQAFLAYIITNEKTNETVYSKLTSSAAFRGRLLGHEQ